MSAINLLHHVAVVSDSEAVGFGEVAQVSAALQRQAQHLASTWDINATVDSFAKLEDVPIDYWPIIIRDDINVPGAAGIHLDKDGQPFSLVQYSNGWSLTASHELLEMLCDPTGNRVKAGPSPKPGQGRVNFLVEVCDPSEAAEFGYAINGISVSDFYLPSYFDPVAVTGTRYSWTGAITQPRQVLKGGYLSWHDPISDEWFQETYFGNQPEFRPLGKLTMAEGSIRNAIYSRTPEALPTRAPKAANGLFMAPSLANLATSASQAKAGAIRGQVDRLLGKI